MKFQNLVREYERYGQTGMVVSSPLAVVAGESGVAAAALPPQSKIAAVMAGGHELRHVLRVGTTRGPAGYLRTATMGAH